MKEQTSWCTYRDKKMNKVAEKYLKNVRMVRDSDRLEREKGEIDFLKIPREVLIDVFDNIEELRYKHNYDKKSARWSQDDYYDLTDTMWDFDYEMKKNFNMHEEELFKLFKNYLAKVADIQKYGNFAKLLSATCRLTYTDYDGYEYCDYDEHPHPSQEDINHNFVGDYELVVMKPIPLKIIYAMKKRVSLLVKNEKEKSAKNFDKKYSLKELDDLEDNL